MISIHDFKVGETAYMLNKSRKPEQLIEVQVESIGRKYVTVNLIGWKLKFEVNNYSPYALTEKTEYSKERFLFATEDKYNEYKEIKELEYWLQNATRNIYNRFSLEQLRKLREIIESEKIENE